MLSRVPLFQTPRILACQAPLSMEFSRQKYWSGFPFPSLGDLPDPGIKSGSPVSHADSSPSEPPGKPGGIASSVQLSRVRLFETPWTVAYQAPCPWDFPGNSTGVDRHFLLQGIFLTQGSNPGLLHCRQTLYRLSHQGSPVASSYFL